MLICDLPHILRRFDGWDIFKDYIDKANTTDYGTSNNSEHVIMEKD
jgi:hypothetical protein